MKRFYILCLTAGLFLCCTACGIIERNRNVQNMKSVRVGMTKKQVLAIMGEPERRVFYGEPEVWLYYTRTAWYDGYATRDECSPFVFDEDGKLLGFGTKYFNDNYFLVNWSRKEIQESVDSSVIRWNTK